MRYLSGWPICNFDAEGARLNHGTMQYMSRYVAVNAQMVVMGLEREYPRMSAYLAPSLSV